MEYKVHEVKGEKGMKDFLDLPAKIYAGDKNRVEPLRSEIKRFLDRKLNPYFAVAQLAIFVCYKREEPVSRAIAVINPAHWIKWKKKSAFFGFFESLRDPEAVDSLFTLIESWCRNEGAEFLEGPFNPNHYSELGLLTSNFDSPPVFFEPYNPQWYQDLLAGAGFIPEKEIHTRINYDPAGWVKTRCKIINTRNRNSDFRIRRFNILRFRSEMEKMREINNDAFCDNPWFLDLSPAEYMFSARLMFFITSPKLISFIEFRKKPVGVVQCVYDINKLLKPLGGRIGFPGFMKYIAGLMRIRDIVIYAVGIKREFQKSIAAGLIFNELCRLALKSKTMATTWMYQDNSRAIRSAEKLGTKPYRWFTIYSKAII